MADRAHCCECNSPVADAVCLSKCAVAAAVGIFPCRRSLGERNGPHAGDDLRSNGFNHSLRASGARFLFIAAAFRGLDLSPASIEDHAAVTKRSHRFLIHNEGLGRRLMQKNSCLILGFTFAIVFFVAVADSCAQAKPEMKAEEAPLRVALAGLVHGHASGFFDQFRRRTDLQMVGIAEADSQLTGQFAKQYGLQPGIYYSEL